MIYWDTSLLVSALTEESASTVAVEWFENQRPGTLAISGRSLTEVGSALAMKRRRQEIDAPPRGLRSGHALHLAVAMEYCCGLATFDVQLAEAASSLGVAVHPA